MLFYMYRARFMNTQPSGFATDFGKIHVLKKE